MKFKTVLFIETLKLSIFTSIISILIYLIQKHYENQANQYLLIDKKTDSKSCPLYPSKLNGIYDVNIEDIPKVDDLGSSIQNLKNGGIYRPTKCKERQKLAIIIPYRDREDNLLLLLKYLHPMLQRQERYYQIFLVEQYGNDIFNKGRIMNIGVSEALKIDNFSCFIFHDVDLIPENDFNIYECDENPRHLSPAVDELRYTLMYYNLVGGVLALSRSQLDKTNGFSNLYWGWGAEDDDMSIRILKNNYKIVRPPNYVGRYKMILHRKRSRALNRFQLLDYWTRFKTDGVSSLKSLNYTVKKIVNSYLYTNVTVDIGPSKFEVVNDNEYKKANFKFH
jgi:hypothetical protein